MKKWASAPLSDLLKKRSEWITLDPDTSYKQATVRLWGKGVALRGIVKGAEIAASVQLRIRQGDFIMSRIDARHGAFGLVPQEMEGAVVSQDFPVFDVREDRLLPSFLNWMSKTPFFIALCRSASEGTTNRVRLKEDRFFSKEVPLPPLAEQRRIVAQLDAVSERSNQAHHLLAEVNDDLLQIMRAIIWRSPENGGRLMPCREFMEQRHCDVDVEPETAYAFAGVYSFGRGVFRGETKLGSQFSYRELTRLHTNNFVYPKLMAWEGALGVVPPECDGRVVSPEFPVFEIDKEIVDPVVIDTFFRDPRMWPRLQSGSTGTNLRRKRINPNQLLAMEIPIPGKADQHKLVALNALRREVVQRNSVSLQELESLIPSLLDRTFNPEVADEGEALQNRPHISTALCEEVA